MGVGPGRAPPTAARDLLKETHARTEFAVGAPFRTGASRTLGRRPGWGPDVRMTRTRRGRALVGVVAVAVCLGGYLLWPAPTLAAEDMDAVLPTERDLPGFFADDALTGSLKVPQPENKDGRAVLSGAGLREQCAKWREDHDEWACRGVHGVGMATFLESENVFFRVMSTVLAYDDEDAAEAGWKGMVADNHREIRKAKGSRAEERPAGLGDESRAFHAPGVTATAVRTGTVVVETVVWDGSDQVGKADLKSMSKKWPALQLSKIDKRR